MSVRISFPPNQLRAFLQILKAGVAVSRQNFSDEIREVFFDLISCQSVVWVNYLVSRKGTNEIDQIDLNRENSDCFFEPETRHWWLNYPKTEDHRLFWSFETRIWKNNAWAFFWYDERRKSHWNGEKINFFRQRNSWEKWFQTGVFYGYYHCSKFGNSKVNAVVIPKWWIQSWLNRLSLSVKEVPESKRKGEATKFWKTVGTWLVDPL